MTPPFAVTMNGRRTTELRPRPGRSISEDLEIRLSLLDGIDRFHFYSADCLTVCPLTLLISILGRWSTSNAREGFPDASRANFVGSAPTDHCRKSLVGPLQVKARSEQNWSVGTDVSRSFVRARF